MLNFTSLTSTDNDYHKLLYNNLLLLNHVFPPADEFAKIVNLNMFRKNNKKAFQEVVYYLLDVINPHIIRQKIKSWPLMEREEEDNFRKEVLIYIKEIRDNNPDFNIPNILVSHLLSPGGLIFVKFMYKLSQFAMFQHLKRIQINNTILLPIKHKKGDEISNLSINVLKQQNNNLKISIQTIKKEFQEFQDRCTIKAKELNQEKNELHQHLRQYKQLFEDQIKNTNVDINYEIIQIRLDALQKNLDNLDRISELMESCRMVMLNLLNGDCILKYDKNDLKLSNNVSVVDGNGQLNLLRLFKYFKLLLHEQLKDLPNLTHDQNVGMVSTINEITNIYQCIQENLCKKEELLKKTADAIQVLKK